MSGILHKWEYPRYIPRRSNFYRFQMPGLRVGRPRQSTRKPSGHDRARPGPPTFAHNFSDSEELGPARSRPGPPPGMTRMRRGRIRMASLSLSHGGPARVTVTGCRSGSISESGLTPPGFRVGPRPGIWAAHRSRRPAVRVTVTDSEGPTQRPALGLIRVRHAPA